VQRDGQPKQEFRPLGVVLRPQAERVVVERYGSGVVVEPGRAVARVAEGEARAVDEAGVFGAARASKVEGRAPVVRPHLGVILGPSERLDPLGHVAMLRHPLRARDLPIRDISDERVSERELALPGDRGPLLAADEPLPLE